MVYAPIFLLKCTMKRIANFTQTYKGTLRWSPGSDGKNRDFLIDALCHNEGKIESYKLLDLQTFNFHNIDVEHSKQLANKIKTVLPSCEFFVYQDMSLGSTIYKHLNFLKERGMTDFIWIQDDEFFTYNNFNDFRDVIDFYRAHNDIKHINLLHRLNEGVQSDAYSNHPGVRQADNIKISNNINLTKTRAKDIEPANNYVMDFSAFICDIDYFLNNMFHETFAEHLDAYRLEGAVNELCLKNNIQRCFVNVNFFESFNIVGMPPSLGKSNVALQKLKNLVKKPS